MTLDWQTACAWIIVAGALWIMAHRFYSVIASKAAGGCGSCPNKSAVPMKMLPLVQLDLSSKPPQPSGSQVREL